MVLLATFMVTQTLSAATPVTFQVVSSTYEVGNDKPLDVHHILFDSGVIYDVQKLNGRTVTIYDWAREEITIMDRQAHVLTRISTPDLVDFTAKLRATATAKGKADRVGLNSEVKNSGDEYSISYDKFSYSVETQDAPQGEIAAHYGRFFDLAARLNMFQNLGPPKFGLMTLNDRITADGLLPKEITRLVTTKEGMLRHRSTLEIKPALSNEDRDEINQVQSMQQLYRDVPPEEFEKLSR